MECTRNIDYIYENYGYTFGDSDKDDLLKQDMRNRLIRVFDMEKNAFRSFKFDKVKKAKILGEI